jgi:alkanesulfonate monooxygenase SsuD/methylene tetrahydromethanopterin reductase-like flavin-dependent oxidoreductase (luciferase family)
MQLAINVQGQEGITWPDWLALAAACEEHGIETLSRSDHFEGFSLAAADGALDAWGTICGLAAVTRRLRLATLVSPVTFRHPAVLAKLVTTADHISGGRIGVGIGAGWAEREHLTYGFPFPPLGERMALLERQLEVLHEHWTSGVHLPPPVQSPNPPIILGGSAKPRSWRWPLATPTSTTSAGSTHREPRRSAANSTKHARPSAGRCACRS